MAHFQNKNRHIYFSLNERCRKWINRNISADYNSQQTKISVFYRKGFVSAQLSKVLYYLMTYYD